MSARFTIRLKGGGDAPVVVKGGPGSGHRGHAGRPGSVGGSAPGGGVGAGAAHPMEVRQANRMLEGGLPETAYYAMTKAKNAKPGTKWDVLAADEKQLVTATLDGMRKAAKGYERYSARYDDRTDMYRKYLKGMDSGVRDSLRSSAQKLVKVVGADNLEAHQFGFTDAADYFRHLGRTGKRPANSEFMAYHAARKPRSAIVRRYAD